MQELQAKVVQLLQKLNKLAQDWHALFEFRTKDGWHSVQVSV
jgi:hypothetical protein